jgi:uroporphyrinogen-III synthase/uroporphyrinogen III methyltransferase/synthase
VLRAEAAGADFATVVAELGRPWQPLIGAPLQGLDLALLRADVDGGDLAAALAIAGASVTTVALTRAADVPAAPAGLAAVAAAQALAFASARAVERFAELLRSSGQPLRAGHVFAVGPTTASAARRFGLPVDTADGSGGKALAAMVAARLPRGTTIGFPCALGRNPGFETDAAAAGLQVHALPVYRIEHDPQARVPDRAPHALLFTSPSSVAAFRDSTWRPAGARFCAIGPTTAQALRDADLPVAAAATSASTGAIVQALTEIHHARSS